MAETLGMETEANWGKVAQQKNMQRWGTQDRRTQQSPTQYFNTKGTGSAQRQQTAAQATPNMVPRPGGLQIPGGQDKPGQLNPLYAAPTPTKPASRSPLSTSPNAPQPGSDEDDEQMT